MSDFNAQEQEKTYTVNFWEGFLNRFIIFIVVATIVGTILGTVIGLFVDKKVYTAKQDVMLVLSISDNGNTNISYGKLVMPSVPSLVTNNKTIQNARSIYDSDSIYASHVSISYDEDSLIFTLSYYDYSEEEATKKLQAIVESSEKTFAEGSIITGFSSLKNMQNQTNVSTSNSMWKYVLVGFVSGLVLSFCISVVIKALDNTIKTRKELEAITQVNVLSVIDKIKE